MSDSQPSSTNMRLHAVIEGRVQGVGFRAYVIQSTGLDVVGWVRNRWTVQWKYWRKETATLERFLGYLRQGHARRSSPNFNPSGSQPRGFTHFRCAQPRESDPKLLLVLGTAIGAV
jgi:acylphosphatase